MTMPRYIKVEDAVKVANYVCGEFRGIFGRIKERLEALPTVDVVDKDRYDRLLKDTIIISEALNKYQTADFVDVVRCRVCKYSKKLPLCYGCKMNYRIATSGKWFCASGVRRTDDAEIR